MGIAEIFETARQKVNVGEYWTQVVTAAEWEALMPEAFAPGAPHFAPAPEAVLDSELRLVHPALRRGILLRVET